MSAKQGLKFEQLYKSEGYGGRYDIGIDIKVHAPMGETEGLRRVARQVAELLEEQMTRDFHAADLESQARAKEERRQLLACFPESPVYVHAVPNGYCRKACCEHLPWYQVTTRLGVITIGWRKRVIVLDWVASEVKAKAGELFPAEDVTKYERTIHAWGYEKAREYLTVLLSQPAGAERPLTD